MTDGNVCPCCGQKLPARKSPKVSVEPPMGLMDMVPKGFKQAEAQWRRRHAALRLRDAGMTFKAIGEALRVNPERARQIVYKAERQRERGTRSPIQLWVEREMPGLHDARKMKAHRPEAVMQALEAMADAT